MANTCSYQWDGNTWTGPIATECDPGYVCGPAPTDPGTGLEVRQVPCVLDPAGPAPIPTTLVGQYGQSVLGTIDPSSGTEQRYTPDLSAFTAEQLTKGLTFAVKNTTPSNAPWTLTAHPSLAGTLLEHPDGTASPSGSVTFRGSRRCVTYEYNNASNTWLCRPEHHPATTFDSIYRQRDSSTSINSVTPVTLPLVFAGFDDRMWSVNASGQLVAQVAMLIASLDAKVRVECLAGGNNQQVQVFVNWSRVVGDGTSDIDVAGGDFTQTSRAAPEPAIFTPTTDMLTGPVAVGDTFALLGAVDASSNFSAVDVTGLIARTEVLLA